MGKPKLEKQPTNGPHAWGNGPKPYGLFKRLALAIAEKKGKK